MANGEKGKGRSQNQRLKLFYLLDYLLENTDETHTKKVQEIIEHFENYYKIPVEQKTVCSDLHLLDEYGYETQYDGRTRGWRIIEREFDNCQSKKPTQAERNLCGFCIFSAKDMNH